jgi:hypothetical protein
VFTNTLEPVVLVTGLAGVAVLVGSLLGGTAGSLIVLLLGSVTALHRRATPAPLTAPALQPIAALATVPRRSEIPS